MNAWSIAAIAAAGFLAGAVNAIIGSGSLITFPTLLALGYAPVVANVTNTVGLVSGSVSAVIGYRRELSGQMGRMVWLGIPAALGALLGAGLLLLLSQRVFRAVVPVLIIASTLLVVIQPWLTGHIRRIGGLPGVRVLQPLAVFGTAVYGGYFGAAQGVVLMSLLSLLVDDTLLRLNALKNVFAAIVNASAAIFFIAAAHVDWPAAAVIAISGTVGAQAGSLVGRRLSPLVLRIVIVIAGIASVVKLLA